MSEKPLTKKTLFFYGLSEMPLSIASLPGFFAIALLYGSPEETDKEGDPPANSGLAREISHIWQHRRQLDSFS